MRWGDLSGVVTDTTGALDKINRTFVDASTLGDTEVVPAQGSGASIRVLGVHCVSALAVTLRFKSAGNNNISAGFAIGVNGNLSMAYMPHGWFQTNPNEALNINQSLAVNTGCNIVWVKVGVGA